MERLQTAQKWLTYWNNILLIPMFTLMLAESGSSGGEAIEFQSANLFFCFFFMAEWALGLGLTDDRKKYLIHWGNILDFVSSIPFGFVFQSLRIVRLFRALRLVRVAMRARRFRGRGRRFVKAVGVVGAIVFAGASALHTVEPQTVPQFSDALWWSLVTVSTVGYGDIAPTTGVGRLVGAALVLLGIGVFGYIAGFTASLLGEAEEDEMYRTLLLMNARLARIEEAMADAARKK